MKIKYLHGYDWPWLKDSKNKVVKCNGKYKGYAGIITDTKVLYPLKVDYGDSEKLLFDNGYSCVMYLPEQENWCVSAVYDCELDIVEWYFDILKSQDIDDKGDPFFHDLYLDVVLDSELKPFILDEDELLEALNKKIISEDDYKSAYKISEKIINVVSKDEFFLKEFLISFLNRKSN